MTWHYIRTRVYSGILNSNSVKEPQKTKNKEGKKERKKKKTNIQHDRDVLIHIATSSLDVTRNID
jgi:hypothetical protein